MKNLLEIQSGVMAYGFYEQIKEDKEKGLNNLKTFMKTTIPKKEKPDFSSIGLSDEVLLKYSEQLGGKQSKFEKTNNNINSK